MLEDTTMIQKWDKVFQKSDKVNHRNVTFTNRFGIALVADLYEPKRQVVSCNCCVRSVRGS